jgi:hypothetical protein
MNAAKKSCVPALVGLLAVAVACGTGGSTTSSMPVDASAPEDAGEPEGGPDSAVVDSGACTPGDVVTEDCGNCGRRMKTCNALSVFVAGACTGEPANGCKPGTVDYSTAGCATPDTFRKRTCAATCLWGPYSGTCDPK